MAGLKNVFSREQKLIWDLSSQESASHLEASQDLSRKTGLPVRACQFLLKRFGQDFSLAEMFIENRASEIDFGLLPDMDKAGKLILDGGYAGGIGIYSDFDADGVTSSVILEEALSYLEIQPLCTYFPSRFREGYGFHASAVEEMYEKGVRLIITSDCGITGHKACQVAKKLGCKVIVTDHHRPIEGIPEADAVLDPFLPSWQHLDLSYLTGAGVAYLLCRALFEIKGIDKDIPEDFAHDLLTISIAGDGLALKGLNRIFVKSGTRLLAQGKRPGIRALLALVKGDSQKDNSNCDGSSAGSRGVDTSWPLDYERDVMFGIVPRINAAGRMSTADKACQLLREKDLGKAMALSKELDELNTLRRQEEDRVLSDFSAVLPKDTSLGSSYVILGESPKWHEGVIGIASSRLRETYFRPALLLAGKGEIMKGSLRGIPGFDVPKVLSQCKEFLISYGGHEGAGGLSIQRQNVTQFFQRFEEVAKEHMLKLSLWPSISIDEIFPLKCLDKEFLDGIISFSPFGQGNPLPLFLLPDVSIERVRLLGKEQDHLEISVKDANEEDSMGPTQRLIFFRGGKTCRDVSFWGRCDILFSPRENHFINGESHSLVVKDVRPSVNLCGEGYDRLFASWADDWLGTTAVLYTWSPHAAKAIYVALAEMGKKVTLHSCGETGAMAQESLINLASGGVVVSDAPWDMFSDDMLTEKLLGGLSGLRLLCLHEPLKEAEKFELHRLMQKGARVECSPQDQAAKALTEDLFQWLFCTYPQKETMEDVFRFLKSISHKGLVLPWDLGKRWKDVLRNAGLFHVEFAPYEKYLALIESSISILEELGMVSFSVIGKTFFLEIAKPKEPVSLSESRRYLEGKMLLKKAEGFK